MISLIYSAFPFPTETKNNIRNATMFPLQTREKPTNQRDYVARYSPYVASLNKTRPSSLITFWIGCALALASRFA